MYRKLTYISTLFLLSMALLGFIIIHPETSDSEFVVPHDAFPPLVDLPESGHGVLIDSQWVITAAHTVDPESLDELIINNKPRKVSKVIIHPEFQASYHTLERSMEGLVSLNETPEKARSVMQAKENMDDIALIKLLKPVEDVQPVKLYLKTDEFEKKVILFGKGATGNGEVGQYENSSNRKQLRKAHNKIEEAYDKWLLYKFDCDQKVQPKEGVMGRGDSGGPVLISEHNEWYLAGLASGIKWEGTNVATFQYGVCGQYFYNSRISYYSDWIDQVMLK